MAKAANQMLVGAALAALGEAVLLLERADVDPALALQALAGGLAGSRILQVRPPRSWLGTSLPPSPWDCMPRT